MALGFKGWYEVRTGQGFVEVVLIIENTLGDTVMADTVGEYDSMEEAQHFLSYLATIDAKIKYIDAEAYTG